MADLITLDQYKDLEGISSSSEDTKLEIIIPSVSQLIRTYCNRGFSLYATADKVETFSIDCSTITCVQLDESPIISVTSVEIRTAYNAAYTTLTEGAYEFYIDNDIDGIVRTDETGAKIPFPQGRGAVKVTYKGGWTTVPLDLLLAAADLVTYYLKHQYKERQTIASTSITNVGTASARNDASFPDHIKRVLDLYRI
jgi:hypothetical protein